MNAEEQTVTWLISLGVLSSPKKTVADAEGFLKAALRDGVVLCRLMERLQPGCVHKYCAEPRSEAECLSNIREFLKGCAALKVEGFDPESVYTGENFGKVVSTLLAINFATQGKTRLRFLTLPVCPATSLLCISDIFCLMCLNGSGQLLVKARFNFKQNNEDELSFTKGELISVTRQEEGGWWEGTLNGKTGWFPSNYVREVKPSEKPLSPKGVKGFEVPQLTKSYYSVVVQDILDHERDFVKELQTLLSCYLRPLLASDRLSSTDGGHLVGNLEDILTFQQGLCVALEECAKMPEGQQRLGGCYLNLLCQIRMLYLSYCSTHPSAVCVLTEHGEGLEAFMESQGASGHGVLSLTTGLSKPFLRLEKYPTLLQELERHRLASVCGLPRSGADHLLSACRLQTQCNEVRKRKALELQILSEPLRGWEGESVRSLGHVIHTSHVHLQMGAGQDKEERYLMLFPNVLLMLSASPRMSGFIYQGRLPLSGATVAKQVEDADGGQFAFEITGGAFERLTVFCSSQQDLQEWLDHLHALTKGGSPVGTVGKVARPRHGLCINNVCDSLKGADGKPGGAAGPPGHQGYGAPMGNRGPLEPPKINKPWSLSCLRPAPPLKPSAALGYKEDTSKSPRPIKKFLPKRKTERKHSDDEVLLRKSTAALEEDAQILKVIEAYCTGASMHQATTGEEAPTIWLPVCLSAAARKESVPQVLLPEEEKIIVEEVKSNGQTVIEEKSLVDAVYALKDEVLELKKRMKQCLEEEQRSRKELERIVRRLAKQKNDCVWDDSGH
uniref:Rac/Cdc42 guanine nucleotide exchange factor 6 n=1 Tax=Scleropages formosus TaxID=113540 RepID=A0A8C9REC3_SCLFO